MDIIADLLGQWSKEVNIGSTALKIGLTVILAAFLGWERVRTRHTAGLRTFLVVGLASTSAAIADLFLIDMFKVGFAMISAATLIGLAIIGTNSILFSSRNQLKGLTTSAELLAAAIVSLVLGFGLYTVALLAYVLLIVSLTLFTKIENITKRRSSHFDVHLELKARNLLQEFTLMIRAIGLEIDDIEINHAYANSGLGVYSVSLTVADKELRKKSHTEIISALSALDCVFFVEEI